MERMKTKRGEKAEAKTLRLGLISHEEKDGMMQRLLLLTGWNAPLERCWHHFGTCCFHQKASSQAPMHHVTSCRPILRALDSHKCASINGSRRPDIITGCHSAGARVWGGRGARAA